MFGILLTFVLNSQAQTHLNLAQALKRAATQNPALIIQRLRLEHRAALEDQGRGHPMANIGYSFEELGTAGSGIHALGIQQSFNLPAVGQRQADRQRALLEVESSVLVVQEQQVKRAVAQGYQTLVYYRHQQVINRQLMGVYDSLVLLAQRRAEVGETGVLPLLAAQSARQQLVLTQLAVQQQFQAALMDWQLLLNDGTLLGVQDSLLVPLPFPLASDALITHPLLLQLQQQQRATTAQKAVLETQLLPQLQTGVQLQLVEGTFPNVGGQLGFNVPLFNRGVRAQLRANERATARYQQALQLKTQQITLQRQQIHQQLMLLQQQLTYFQDTLLPTLRQQVAYSSRVYTVGEASYLAVLQSLEQYLTAQQQYLSLLWQYNHRQIDYKYWMGE